VGLRSRDDGGLGPLSAGLIADKGLVAVRASAETAYGASFGLTVTAGQKLSHASQNRGNSVLSERAGAIHGITTRRKIVADQMVMFDLLR
jgi:hypothetical protein